MNRQEFLEILRSQLAGHMQEGKAAAHVRYYEDYIQSQVRGGRTEQEVLDQLGDPRLIAKTLIDTEGDTVDEEYGAYSSCGSGLEPPPQPEKRWKKVLDLSTWSGKLVVIVAAAVAIILLLIIIGAVLPFFIILFIILSVISWFTKRSH